MAQKTIDILLGIPHRILSLVVKVISVKGLVLALATWLVYEGKLDAITWAMAAAGVVGTRAWEKQNAATNK